MKSIREIEKIFEYECHTRHTQPTDEIDESAIFRVQRFNGPMK